MESGIQTELTEIAANQLDLSKVDANGDVSITHFEPTTQDQNHSPRIYADDSRGGLITNGYQKFRSYCYECSQSLKTHNLCIVDGLMETQKMYIADRNHWLLTSIDGLLRGFGQVVFCNNPLSGALILIALLIGDVYVGVLAFVSAGTATFGSCLFGIDTNLVHSGLMTYNSVLVGCCLGTFIPGIWFGYTFVFAIMYGFFSVVVQLALANFLKPYSVPTLTMSFNLMALACLTITYGTAYVPQGSLSVPETFPILPKSTVFFDGYLLIRAFPIGLSQVFFVNNLASGILIFMALLICSRIIAFAAFMGSICGAFVGLALGVSSQQVYDGLWGYNSVLGCAAIVFFFVPTPRSAFIAVFCAVYCALVFGALRVALLVLGMPCFTLPFCVTTYAFLFMQNSLKGIRRSDLNTLTTPEAICEFC